MSTFLENNFAPVHEEHDFVELEFDGKIQLDGMYIRNGPNPGVHVGKNYHWFAGDGMLHAIYFKDNKAYYVNKFIKTSKYTIEKEIQTGISGSFGELSSAVPQQPLKLLFWLLRNIARPKLFRALFDRNISTGNTALAHYNQRLLALVESSLPTHIIAPSLDTAGIYDFNTTYGTYSRNTFLTKFSKFPIVGKAFQFVDDLLFDQTTIAYTAHPKIDYETKDIFSMSYSASGPCHYFVANKHGKPIVNSLQLDFGRNPWMHDFVITKKYAIFFDCNLLFDFDAMKRGEPILGVRKNIHGCIWVFPRYSNNPKDLICITGKDLGIVVHFANAFEINDNTIEVIASRSNSIEIGNLQVLDLKDTSPNDLSYLTRYTIDLKSKTFSQQRLTDVVGEFPVINKGYTAKSNQYVYFATTRTKFVLFDGICKIDLKTNQTQILDHGKDWYSGESLFVSTGAREDDGFVMSFVHNEVTNKDEFRIANALNMEVVSVIKVPFTVPYGFHGYWLSKEDIKNQVAAEPIKDVKHPFYKLWLMKGFSKLSEAYY